jgi:hypothetical protein
VATNWGWVTSHGGKILISVTEVATDEANNRSQINIVGSIENDSGGPVVNSTTMTCNTSGTDNQGDNLGVTGSNWTIGGLTNGASKTFINSTVWAGHNSDGTGSVTMGVHYNQGSTTVFGTAGSISVSLTLTTLQGAPDVPTGLAASNIQPTSLTLSWDAVSGATNYAIIGDQGDSITSGALNYSASGTTVNITGLAAGKDYTFAVYAFDRAGYSGASSPLTVQTLAGCWIRVGGVWKTGIPYVRVGGVWKMALPYIRQAGTWQQTH